MSTLLQAADELLFAGLTSRGLPPDYCGPLVTMHPESGFILAVGDEAGEIIATERLHLVAHYSDVAPPRTGGPLPERVRDAWTVLRARAWQHARLQKSEGARP